MNTSLNCVIVETLTITQLAHACQVEVAWVHQRLHSGLLLPSPLTNNHQIIFDAQTLKRVQRMRDVERNFDANPELAALVADLLEQLDQFHGETD